MALTESFVVTKVTALALAAALVERSALFQCEPHPNDYYEFMVKLEQVPYVKNWLLKYRRP